MNDVSRCDFCGQLVECREFARQTNPQYGVWCRDCHDSWQAVVTFQPMAYGGMLLTGWDDDDDEDKDAE